MLTLMGVNVEVKPAGFPGRDTIRLPGNRIIRPYILTSWPVGWRHSGILDVSGNSLGQRWFSYPARPRPEGKGWNLGKIDRSLGAMIVVLISGFARDTSGLRWWSAPGPPEQCDDMIERRGMLRLSPKRFFPFPTLIPSGIGCRALVNYLEYRLRAELSWRWSPIYLRGGEIQKFIFNFMNYCISPFFFLSKFKTHRPTSGLRYT